MPPPLNALRASRPPPASERQPGGRRAARDAGGGQPSGEGAGGMAGRPAVPPPQPPGPAHRCRPDLLQGPARRLRPPGGNRREAARTGGRGSAYRQRRALLCGQVAAAAPRALQKRPPRHRSAHRCQSEAVGLRARQRRYRHPLRARQLSRPARRSSDGRRMCIRCAARSCCGDSHGCAIPATSPAARCCISTCPSWPRPSRPGKCGCAPPA